MVGGFGWLCGCKTCATMYTRCQSVSCEGLILVRQLAAKWLKVRLDARVLNKIDPGPFYSAV